MVLNFYTQLDNKRLILSKCLKEKIMKNFTSFLKEEDGMGTVEVVLIIVVLIMLVALFKEKIKALAEKLLKKVSDNANKI